MKKLKVTNPNRPKMHGDVRGLHLSTPSSKAGSASVSVTGQGAQVSAGNKNFTATVNKQVKTLSANAGKTRLSVDSNKNINTGYGNLNVNHSPYGTGVNYKNESVYKPKNGGYSASVHQNIKGMATSFELGKNPKQGNYGQIKINIPTGRRNK